MGLNVAIFAGSREGFAPEFKEQAKELGRLIGEKNWNVFCGDGEGLADIVINAVKEVKGTKSKAVNFVTPEKLHVESPGERVMVQDVLHQQSWLNKADAYIALPGSGMTLSEIFSALVEIFRNKSEKVVALLNTNDFYSGLLDFFQNIATFGFSAKRSPHNLKAFNDPETLIKNISQDQNTYYG